MKIFKSTLIGLLGLSLLSSCSDKEDPDGQWGDIIKLSTKNVDFQAAADSIIISTEGDWWWVDGINFEDSLYSYYDNPGINLEAESYTIEEDDFVVARQDAHTLFIRLNANQSGQARTMRISLEAGDYFDDVTVTQAAN